MAKSSNSNDKSHTSEGTRKESTFIANDYDTFLNFDLYKKIKSDIVKCFHFMKDTKDVSKVLSKLSSKFNYIKTFKHQGVQGLTGILTANNPTFKELPVVFKLSVEIDKVIDHESTVIEDLNKIRAFCPHFVSSFFTVQLPVSRTYIYTHTLDDENQMDFSISLSDDSDRSSSDRSDDSSSDDSNSEEDSEFEQYTIDDVELFMNDGEYLPTNVLFMEYVSGVSFSDICSTKIKQNKDIILSQILMILSALVIAQEHCKFTHYDLHIDNILIRNCEPNALFLYKFNDGNENTGIIVPTFGFYPVIIDMGSSFSESVLNNQMTTTISNYNHGLQPVLYDHINDLHHFLLSSLYDLEYASDEFYYLSTHMIYYFRHIPVLRKKGWKQLPNNLMKNVVKRINTACQDIKITTSDESDRIIGLKALEVWTDMDRDLIEILSYGIRVPWTNQLDEELDTIISKSITDENERLDEAIRLSFIPFLKEFQKFDNMKCFEDPNDLLFVLKELVDIVYKNWDSINKLTSKQTLKFILSNFKYGLNKEFRDMPASLNFTSLIISCKYCISIINKLCHEQIKQHKEIIEDCYSKSEIKSAVDMLKWFKQNSSVRVNYTPESIIYVWDSIMKNQKRVVLGDLMRDEEIEKLNKEKPLQAQKDILSKL